MGGIAALLDATIPVNFDLHDALWVPAHFHTYLLEGVLSSVRSLFVASSNAAARCRRFSFGGSPEWESSAAGRCFCWVSTSPAPEECRDATRSNRRRVRRWRASRLSERSFYLSVWSWWRPKHFDSCVFLNQRSAGEEPPDLGVGGSRRDDRLALAPLYRSGDVSIPVHHFLHVIMPRRRGPFGVVVHGAGGAPAREKRFGS